VPRPWRSRSCRNAGGLDACGAARKVARRRADVARLLFRDKRRELALITQPVWPDGPAFLGSSIRNKLSADS
jgi:hypothetical protein